MKDDGEVTPLRYSLQILKSRYCLCRAAFAGCDSHPVEVSRSC